MSSVVISGDTSGSITLSAPAVAGSNTITLPAATGTVVLTGTTPTLNGITFPTTQVPSADANTLDDYEEGTWTPVLTGSTGTPTVSYNAQIGTYTKIGRMVMIQMYIETSARSGGSGDVRITGLPFTAANSSASYCGVTPSQAQNITGATTVGVRPFANQAYLELMNNSGATNVAISNWTATGTVLVSLSYIV